MESFEELEKEEEVNFYLMKKKEDNEVNDITLCSTYHKLFLVYKKLDSESSNLKEHHLCL